MIEGKKYDIGKARYDLIPPEPIEEMAKVLAFGAEKYGDNNWKIVTPGKMRYLAALLRHLFSRLIGQANDPETGFPHLAHALCCLVYLLWFDLNKRQKNKRVYISGPISGMPNYNRAAFEEAEKIIKKAGYIPVSPFQISCVSKNKDWDDYMRDDIAAMMDCDYIYMLPGWEKSKGANIENRLSMEIGMPELNIINDCDENT